MPCDYSKYPANWKTEIRPDILERACNRCEEKGCGVKNYSEGFWGKDDLFWTVEEIITLLEETGRDLFDSDDVFGNVSVDKKPIKIILTISHTDHDITNNDYLNLKALCQRHHLRHDVGHHKESRNKKKRLQKLF